LNFIFGNVYLCVCVCAFSLRRESLDVILGDKPLISEAVLSQNPMRLLKRIMLIVSIQGRKRRDLLKDSECKLIEVNKHRVGVEHL
jgi:hypothetical protein